MALFGEQSKEVEQTLLKVQSAMALSQGLQQIGESIDSFKQLGAVAKSYTIVQRIVTAGQWLWNAALAANPIGAVVAGIVALIAAGVALVNYFKSSSDAAAKNTASVKENEKAIKNQSRTLEQNSTELDRKQKHELAMAKASGASASAIRALELKLIDEKIAYEKEQRQARYADYESWLAEAHEAGMKAVQALNVVPMLVQAHSNPLDDSSPVVQSYFVGDGVCGFAWITVRPANSSFGLYVKKNHGWKSAYGGGIQKWVSDFNQSMQKKYAYASAFAQVLNSHGIVAIPGERMD